MSVFAFFFITRQKTIVKEASEKKMIITKTSLTVYPNTNENVIQTRENKGHPTKEQKNREG